MASSTTVLQLDEVDPSRNVVKWGGRPRLSYDTASSNSGGEIGRLLESLWEGLPDEVISTILACLPLISLLRFRAVCKKWKALLNERQFHETRARMFPVGGGELYRQYIQLAEKAPYFSGSQVIASVGGLLLLTANERDDVQVIDPSKASLRKVPPMPNLSSRSYIGCGMVKNQNVPNSGRSGSKYYTIGMTMHPQTRVYNILAVSKGNRGPVAIQLYDSGLDSWRSAGSIAPEPAELRFHVVSVVLYEECLHCLTVGLNEDLTPNFRVLSYDKQQRRWHELIGAFPRVRYDNRSSPLLFEHRGRLLFAGASRKSFCIWRYDSVGLEWVLIDCLPQVTLMKSETGLGFFSHACGDHLCVGTYPIQKMCLATWAQPLNRRRSFETSTLIYNIGERQWRELPGQEAESRLVCWLRRKFLYESSPFGHCS